MSIINLKATSGLVISFNKSALISLESEAKKAYQESTKFFDQVNKLKGIKAVKFERSFIGNRDFQHFTSAYVVSYKKNLLTGDFKGFNFMLQFIKNYEDVPAGTILKW